MLSTGECGIPVGRLGDKLDMGVMGRVWRGVGRKEESENVNEMNSLIAAGERPASGSVVSRTGCEAWSAEGDDRGTMTARN
jgi:hypothetical protein